MGVLFFKYFFIFKNNYIFVSQNKVMEEIYFKYHFETDLKDLGLKRYTVCKMLNCTMPTLSSRLNNPGTFTVSEIKTLKNEGFVSMDKLV
tara:strand:+ start:273 stop:542 length:270 start_codon:yes stop_codon:yes gene_type:complete